jgi:hypothetical protein
MIRILEVPGESRPAKAAVGAGPTSARGLGWEDR